MERELRQQRPWSSLGVRVPPESAQVVILVANSTSQAWYQWPLPRAVTSRIDFICMSLPDRLLLLVVSGFLLGAESLRVGAGSRLAKPSRSDARRAA